MEIRKILAEKPAIRNAVIVAVFALASLILWKSLFSTNTVRMKAFFSDDDGKTWFADDWSKFSPFDHDGMQAYRAHVFRCGDGPPFVGYLESYAEEVKPVLEKGHPDINDILVAMQRYSDKSLVKKPGDAKWVSRGTPAITTPRCPAGSKLSPQEFGPGE